MLSLFRVFHKSLIGHRLLLALSCLLPFVLAFRPVGGYFLLLAWSLSVFICILPSKDSLSFGERGRGRALMSDPALFSMSIFSVVQVTGVFASRLPGVVGSSFAGYSPPSYQLCLIISSFLLFSCGLIFPDFARGVPFFSLEGKKEFFSIKTAIQVFFVLFVLATCFHISNYSHLNYSSLRPVSGLLMISTLGLLLFDYTFPGPVMSTLVVFLSAVFGQFVLLSDVPGFESLLVFVAIVFWGLSLRSRAQLMKGSPVDMGRENLNLSESMLVQHSSLRGRHIAFVLVSLVTLCFLMSDVLRSSFSFVVLKYIATISDPLSYPRLSSISDVSRYLSNSGLIFGSAHQSWNHLLSHNSFLDIAVRQGFLPAVALFSFYLFVLRRALRKVVDCGFFPLLVSLSIFLYSNVQPFIISDGYGIIISFFVLGLVCAPSGHRHDQLKA